MRWYLAVDLGTQGPKIAAIDDGGEILVDSFTGVRTFRTRDGAATQEPGEWWEALRSLVGETCAALGSDRPVAIALTGQYGSTVPTDAEGSAVGPCLLWADARGAEESVGRRRRPGEASLRRLLWERLAGGASDLTGGDPLGHEHLLRTRYPAIWKHTRTLLEPIDYLGLRLTGRVAATPASMIASFLVRPADNAARPRYSPMLLRLSRRDASRLPPLIPTGTVLGPLSAEASADLGVAAEVPVIAGIPDLHSAYLGSGGLSPGEAHLVLSSSSWVGLATRRARSDSRRGINTVPGIGPGHLLVENNQSNAGIALDWVLETVWPGRSAAGHEQYNRFVEAALRSPSGADGVVFAPWLSGERAPLGAPHLQGAFLGLSTTTTSDDIARATLEGLAANTRLLVTQVSRVTRTPITELRLMGRCAELDGLCQVFADVTRLPCHRVKEPRLACLRGAAALAARVGGHPDISQVEAWSPIDRTFRPNASEGEPHKLLHAHSQHIASSLKRTRRALT